MRVSGEIVSRSAKKIIFCQKELGKFKTFGL